LRFNKFYTFKKPKPDNKNLVFEKMLMLLRLCTLFRLLLLFGFIFASSVIVTAQKSIILNDETDYYSINNELGYYIDTNGALSIEQLLSGDHGLITIEQERNNFAMSDNVYWFQFLVDSKLTKENNLIIEFEHPLVEDIRFFLIDSSGLVVNMYRAGLKYDSNQHEIVHRNPIFPISIGKGKYRVVMRIDTRSAVYTSINIHKYQAFWQYEQNERSFVFLLSGILLAISILNLVLFFLVGERSYFLLASFFLVSIILFSSTHGYLFEFLPDIPLLLKVKSRIISYQIGVILLSFFAIKFLDLKQLSMSGFKIMKTAIIFYLVFFMASVANVIPVIIEYKLVVFSYPVFVVIQILVIVIAIKKQNKSAIYFFVSFVLYLFISSIFILVIYGVVAGNIITNNISIIGTAIFSLLLTIGLNEKITKLKKLESKAIQLAEDKEELANEIDIRIETEEALKKSELRLNNANKAKDKFFSILAHDLITPFNTILGFSSLLKENLKTNDLKETGRYVELISSSANKTLRLLENLLDWSRSQTNNIEYRPEPLNVKPIIADIISLYDSQKYKKQIEIVINVDNDIIVCADSNMLQTVVRNLISNAFKFTEKGKITIRAKKIGSDCEITIEDTGAGIAKKQLNNLFKIDINTSTKGTHGEEGTGIGLILCKELVEKNKGQLFIESQIYIGSKFTFTVPLSDKTLAPAP